MTVQSCPSMTIVTPLRKSFEDIIAAAFVARADLSCRGED
jgi:hypothetical protein